MLLCEGANAFGNLPVFLLQVTVAFGKVSFKQFVVLCHPAPTLPSEVKCIYTSGVQCVSVKSYKLLVRPVETYENEIEKEN